jgi:tRNA (guanine37-N1)-methyltransferase
MADPALDRGAFDTDIKLIALKIPAKSCSEYMKTFEEITYTRPKLKKVYEAPGEPQKRLLVLSEQYQDMTLSNLPENLKEFNDKHGGEPVEYTIHLGYDHFGAEEVLRRILPTEIKEIPSSFEQAGHLAHLNLRDEALPYKHAIAQVLLDKNPSIKTVVNKIGNIETEFRTFPMEVTSSFCVFALTLRCRLRELAEYLLQLLCSALA